MVLTGKHHPFNLRNYLSLEFILSRNCPSAINSKILVDDGQKSEPLTSIKYIKKIAVILFVY